MPFSLSSRAVDAREHMDDPACDQEILFSTFRHFAMVNRLVAGWRRLYRRELRPLFLESKRPLRLLDIGCGGGDIPRALWRWATADGFSLRVIALDADSRAIQYARRSAGPEDVQFRTALLRDLLAEGATFDIVLSNNLLHHLAPADFSALLEDVVRLAPRRVLFNDIRRSALAFGLYAMGVVPFLRHSYVASDGLTSIRRSYTVEELRALSPPGWTVRPLCPFRLLLTRP